MRAEAAALLRLVGAAESAPSPSYGSPDPQRLLELAHEHQVTPLAYQRWKSLGAAERRPDIPTEVRASFRMSYLHHGLRNEVLAKHLVELGNELAERGIESLVFKGPWLAFHAYPDPGTREVDDIDLGIHERDYKGTLEVLASLGYRLGEDLPSTPEEALRRAHYGRQLRFTGWGRRPLEVHFRMVNLGPPTGEERWLWERTRTLQLADGAIRVPGAEAMLLHLLMHANQHGFAVLRLLFDVRFALERAREELDVAAFLGLVREHRLEDSAYHGLLLARELAGASVPQVLLDSLRPNPLRRARFSWLWRVSAVRRLEAPRRRNDLESPRLYLLEMGRLSDKARYLRAVVREAGGLRAFLRSSRAVADGRHAS